MGLTRRLGAAALAAVVGTIGLVVAPSAASAAPIIVCRLKVDIPHHSTTVLGTVNVKARTTCTAPVGSISMVVSHFRDGVNIGSSGIVTGPGASVVNAMAPAPCIRGVGTYQGKAGAIIVYSPSGVPADATLLTDGPTMTLVCV